ADNELEEALGVSTGEEDRKPCSDHHEERCDPKEEQHNIVRDREQPLHEWEPAVEVAFDIGPVNLDVDRLLFVSRWIAIGEQGKVSGHTGGETREFEVPVEPPVRVLLPEYQQE